jgi:CRP/FNR family transcriptional regulator
MKTPPNPSCHDCDSLSTSVFCDLKSAELNRLDTHKTCNTYKKGQVIFHQGNRPLGLYCVQSGKVKITKMGVEGKEQIVRLAASGDVIGYRSFLAEETYSATASAIDDSSICFIDREDFKSVLSHNASLSENLIKLLSRELRESEDLVRDMAQKSVRERTAEVLILLSRKFGTTTTPLTQLNVQLSREELANYVGTATETLIRLLSDFKEERVIATQGKKIQILDFEKLSHIANIEF